MNCCDLMLGLAKIRLKLVKFFAKGKRPIRWMGAWAFSTDMEGLPIRFQRTACLNSIRSGRVWQLMAMSWLPVFDAWCVCDCALVDTRRSGSQNEYFRWDFGAIYTAMRRGEEKDRVIIWRKIPPITRSGRLTCHQLRRKKQSNKSLSKVIRERPASTTWLKGDFVRDFGTFNFLHLECVRACETQPHSSEPPLSQIPSLFPLLNSRSCDWTPSNWDFGDNISDQSEQ
jgi:hypothetical protein